MNNQKILDTRFFVIGCLLLAAAVGFAIKLMNVQCPTMIHMALLKWILPLASGFAVWSFSGAITVKAQGVIQGLVITATGGFGVWLASMFFLFPNANQELNCGSMTEAVIEVTRASTLEIRNCNTKDVELVEVIVDNHRIVEGNLDQIQVLAYENHQGGTHILQKIEYFNDPEWEEITPDKQPISTETYMASANVPVKNRNAKVRYTWIQEIYDAHKITGNHNFGLGIRKSYVISKIEAAMKFPSEVPFKPEDTKWISDSAKYCTKSIYDNIFELRCGGNGKRNRLEKEKTYGASWEWAPQIICS